jgi:ectoine hydroxylase-related dioxygenase (phytanoyl-CoA dioxygenase family)
MNTTTFPDVDARRQECLTDEQTQFFRDQGLLIIRNVLRGAELKALQDETLPLVDRAARERVHDPDFAYKKHEVTGTEVPFRIEYIVDKTTAGKALLGHPFILRSVEKLQGRDFIPTWDSMVFKQASAGAAIPWHRDEDADRVKQGAPIFNVDFYLDGSDLTNCLWGILGSNQWPSERAQAEIARLNRDGFHSDGAVPIPMQPGDVIFHNVLTLHGSPPAQSKLRRVIYFEFRPAEVEKEFGPHTPEYIPLKQRMLLACLRHRAATPEACGEKPFVYHPSAAFPPATGPLETYRYNHRDYWRK